ncbi:surface antigen-domain-containing protein [Radiomyces spectabilis]|uniref:surface antigen-domain-containing protein n=1 Tax=Radiomyces spectabilis TaxID=64574 RepID=UPI00221F02CA|nr:surface antigen-domain-containing protein [Radiomyces spectabilis]KAI8391578.1 surface antigen-domain-containing protein [Radiomyces spectabilis]
MTAPTSAENTFQIPLHPDAPLQVHSLGILGTTSTRSAFLNAITRPVFEAKTAGNVSDCIKDMAGKLQRHDIFTNIKVTVATNQSVNDAIDVIVNMEEKPQSVFLTSLGVGDNEMNLKGGLAVRNVLGGAETVETTFSFGNRTKAALEGSVGMPINASPDARVSLFANAAKKDYSMINFYDESSKAAGVRFNGCSKYGHHELSYALTHRDITAHTKSSSTVRAQSGENVKSSIYHSFVCDTRDRVAAPTSGHYFGVFQEFAGLGQRGDASFLKQEVIGQYHKTLVGDEKASFRVVLSTHAKAGVLTAFDNKGVNVSDRFYLGGPLSLRGFKMGGIGSRDNNDALGGGAYWAAGASLISDVPGAPELPIKLHAFVNAGNIADHSQGTNFKATAESLAQEPRTSAGVGLVFLHAIARVEANFCIPLQHRTGDIAQPGFQLGFGLNFL